MIEKVLKCDYCMKVIDEDYYRVLYMDLCKKCIEKQKKVLK